MFTALPTDLSAKQQDLRTKTQGLRQRCKLLKDEALLILIRSLAVTLPPIENGSVTIKINYHQSRVASSSVGFESHQGAPPMEVMNS